MVYTCRADDADAETSPVVVGWLLVRRNGRGYSHVPVAPGYG
jgi:hypothetical protein